MSDDLRDALRQADAWRAAAEQRWRLRADFEAELGLSASVAGEENVEHGLAAIRALKAEIEQLRARVADIEWLNEAGCENTPTKGCECPGCGLARERAERGVGSCKDDDAICRSARKWSEP